MEFTTVVLVFLEGILAFVSPCILPMFPVYVIYLAGERQSQNNNKTKLIRNTLGFILGFTLIFVLLGATATTIGKLLASHKILLQQISGVIIIIFGLNFIGVLKLSFLNREKKMRTNTTNLDFLSSLVFGVAFSFGWSPCLGPFLGTAMLLAAKTDTVIQGMFLLFVFSLGLGIPFLISTVILDKLKGTFQFIKNNYRVINLISGVLLIVIGLALLFNVFGYWMGLFS